MLTASSFHEWLESIGMTAAWLQAWGALLALSIAISLAFYNQNQERRREKNKQVQYMEAIAAISSEALQAVSSIISEMHSGSIHDHNITTNELDRCAQALATITLESLPNAKAYMAIYQLRKEIQGICYIVSCQHYYDLVTSSSTLDEVSNAAARLKQADEEFSKALRLAR
ncbi:hypothetical protein [Vreelandella venusta]|uniref:hypothetical protein n=1 Tax=Vreelandella venusta TaxID=44935 RepID=UPI0018DA6E75|nr:hypothetical protein [Halomonas venusta]QPI65891.1 hypothetical protein IR195_09435 [Halomonas venusta]